MVDHWCSWPFGDPQASPNLRSILERSVARYIQCPEDNGWVAYPRVMIENCFISWSAWYMHRNILKSFPLHYSRKNSPSAWRAMPYPDIRAIFTGPFQDFPTSLWTQPGVKPEDLHAFCRSTDPWRKKGDEASIAQTYPFCRGILGIRKCLTTFG
jgi:hypothetical protein